MYFHGDLSGGEFMSQHLHYQNHNSPSRILKKETLKKKQQQKINNNKNKKTEELKEKKEERRGKITCIYLSDLSVQTRLQINVIILISS